MSNVLLGENADSTFIRLLNDGLFEEDIVIPEMQPKFIYDINTLDVANKNTLELNKEVPHSGKIIELESNLVHDGFKIPVVIKNDSKEPLPLLLRGKLPNTKFVNINGNRPCISLENSNAEISYYKHLVAQQIFENLTIVSKNKGIYIQGVAWAVNLINVNAFGCEGYALHLKNIYTAHITKFLAYYCYNDGVCIEDCNVLSIGLIQSNHHRGTGLILKRCANINATFCTEGNNKNYEIEEVINSNIMIYQELGKELSTIKKCSRNAFTGFNFEQTTVDTHSRVLNTFNGKFHHGIKSEVITNRGNAFLVPTAFTKGVPTLINISNSKLIINIPEDYEGGNNNWINIFPTTYYNLSLAENELLVLSLRIKFEKIIPNVWNAYVSMKQPDNILFHGEKLEFYESGTYQIFTSQPGPINSIYTLLFLNLIEKQTIMIDNIKLEKFSSL